MLCYFESLSELTSNYNFGNLIANRDTTEYMTSTFIPEGINSLKLICEIYAKEFKYDVARRVGLSKAKKDEAKELFDTKGMTLQ